MPNEESIAQSPRPTYKVITKTYENQNKLLITPTTQGTLVPTKTPTPKEESFQLYKFLPDGEYLIIGIQKQFALPVNGERKIDLPDNITFDSARIFSDGSKIVVVASNPNSFSTSHYFRIIDPLTGSQIDIPGIKDCISVDPPGLSPDGFSLIFSCKDKIVMLSIPDGKEMGRLVFDEKVNPDHFSVNAPMWSPDGKWIAFRWSDSRMDPGMPGDQVLVISVDCFQLLEKCLEKAKKFSFQGRTGYNLFDWGANNQLILLDQLSAEIRIFDIDSMKLYRIIPLPSLFTVENMAISPDGNQIAFGQQTADKKEAAIYIASIDSGKIRKVYTERYRVDVNFVNFWFLIPNTSLKK